MRPNEVAIRPARRLRVWAAAAVFLLLAANVVGGVGSLGRRAGVTYVWVCGETGAELSYNPSVFPGQARLVSGADQPAAGYRWELVQPAQPSAWLPWNWLAVLLDEPYPDPDAVLRERRPGPG